MRRLLLSAFRLPAFRLLALCLLLSACAGQTAAQGVVANPDLAATAQMDQYRRDAQATQSARDAEIERLTLEIQMTAQSATSTAQVVGVTQTAIARAQSTRAADDATSTHVARLDATATTVAQIAAAKTATAETNAIATGTAAVIGTQTSIRLTTEQAEAARLRIQTWMTMLGLALLVIIVVAVCIWLSIIAGRNLRKRGHIIPTGPNGSQTLAVVEQGDTVQIYDPLNSPTAALALAPDGMTPLHPFSAQDQLAVALARLYVLMEQARHSPFPPVPGQPERKDRWRLGPIEHEHITGALGPGPAASVNASPSLQRSDSQAPAQLSPAAQLPTEAHWRLLDDWRGGALPLGVGPSGLLLADPEQHAHWLIAGSTGTGKSRYVLKPLVAAALSDGWQVILFDRTNLHFAPFRSHPNAHFVTLDQPEMLIVHLHRLHAEVNRRFKILSALGAETWRDTRGEHGPRILAVVDDYGILGDMLDTAERRALWLATRRLVADSRKSGIHLCLVVQSPTWQSIDLGIRRNCTPLTLRVNDADASRVLLNAPGAESLLPRRFLTMLPALTPGVAFTPDDADLTGFLAARPAAALARPDWLMTENNPPTIEAPDDEARVLTLHASGVGITEIQRQVFGTGPGGRDYYRVKSIISGSKPAENAYGE